MPRTRVDPKVPKDASHQDRSDAALRFDVAPRRFAVGHAPKSCLKIDLRVGGGDRRLATETAVWRANRCGAWQLTGISPHDRGRRGVA